MSETFDLVIIGGGTAGLSAAQTAIRSQGRVLIVSEGPLGGECTWNGCVPSKALIEAARVHHVAVGASRFGIRVGEVGVDFPAVMAHVQDVIDRIADYEDEAHLEKTGVIVRRGRARLLDAGTLEVAGERISTGRILICTGSLPAAPPIPGLESVPHLTNESLFHLREQPRRLIVLGAGPIGLEMAQAFVRLGSAVEVVDVVAELLPREDPDVTAVARRILEDEGVRFALGVTPTSVSHEDGEVRLALKTTSGERTLAGDALLVATGRRPNVAGLGLEEVGVKVAKPGIVVDDHLRTSVRGIFAAGDVTGILPFTHVAAYQGRLAAANALGKKRAASYRVVPWIIFTEPEIAHVGATEPEARREHGDSIRCVSIPFTAVDRAVITRQPRGLIKIVTTSKPLVGHAGGGSIVGAHIIGPGAGELIHEFVIGMQVRAFAGRLAQAIHAYPAMSLGVQQAVAQLFDAGQATAGENREELVSVEKGPATA